VRLDKRRRAIRLRLIRDPIRIQNGIRMMSESYAQGSSSNGTDVVVEIASAGDPNDLEHGQPQPVTRLAAAPSRGFKRRFERARGLIEEQDFAGSSVQEDDLRLQVMLLQEENARLKAARHKQADPGSLIEEVRTLADASAANELLDETWSVLGECLALREGLDRACIEIQAAMNSVRERLSTLGVSIESIGPDNAGTHHGDKASLSA
jgi:hypothetical protein